MPLMCGASELSSTLCTSTSIKLEGLPMFTTFLLFTVFTGLLDIHHSATTARTCLSQNKSSGATTTSQTNSGRMFQTTVLKRSILLFFHSFFFHQKLSVFVCGLAKDMVRQMLTVTPEKRINLEEALQHSWLEVRNLTSNPV